MVLVFLLELVTESYQSEVCKMSEIEFFLRRIFFQYLNFPVREIPLYCEFFLLKTLLNPKLI